MSSCPTHPGAAGSSAILSVQLHSGTDVIAARRRATQIAERLGFDPQDQYRFAAAVFEVASEAIGAGASVEFCCTPEPPALLAAVTTRKQGGATGAQSAVGLADLFETDQSSDGAVVRVGLRLPPRSAPITPQRLEDLGRELAGQASPSSFEEVQIQNRELAWILADLRARQAEVGRLNGELEETNRGVMALYAELDDRAEQLKEASETKSRFLSNMSHEFRTPLSAIVSLSSMLLDRLDGDLTEEQEKQVGFIQGSARDLIEIVNDLLDIAKIEAGRLVVAPQWFELIELFSALRGMFRPLLLSPNVSMIFEEPGDLSAMYSDQSKIAQILRNFVSNALKFTEQGEIRVSARPGPESTILFAVHDTGIGIPKEMQEHIFEEFSQVDNEIQKRVKGTGLGLPLCRKLAGLLGGSVSVDSAPGAGSTFTLVVPQRLFTNPEGQS